MRTFGCTQQRIKIQIEINEMATHTLITSLPKLEGLKGDNMGNIFFTLAFHFFIDYDTLSHVIASSLSIKPKQRYFEEAIVSLKN